MFGFKKKHVYTISIPREDENEMIYIRIHDFEKISPEDQGRVLRSFIRANKMEGYIDFGKSKNGVFPFVLKLPQSEIDKRLHDIDERVLGMVRVELVAPDITN